MSSDDYGNNCSTRGNVESKGDDRIRRIVTRERKGCLGQKAKRDLWKPTTTAKYEWKREEGEPMGVDGTAGI